MNLKKIVILLSLLVLGSACAIRQNLVTPYNPTNQPVLNDGGSGTPSKGTKYCSPDANGNFNEGAISVQTGMNSDGSAWAEGGGCVLRPIREVWAVYNNAQILKWQAADSASETRTINPTSQFTHLYAMTYNKSTVIGEISWTMDWYEDPTQGTFLDPQQVTINYSRVSGTSNIPVWSGGIVLTMVNDSVTSISMLNTFKARQSDSDNVTSAQQGLNEMIEDARNGQADWLNLNSGFKANPSQPDPAPTGGPAPVGVFCVKDQSGNYPTQPEVGTGEVSGVSFVKTRACVAQAAATLYQAAQNLTAIRWKNSSSVAVTVTPPTSAGNPLTAKATYTATSYLVFKSTWDMSWVYTETPAQNGQPEQYTATYNIDPATTDFPVWTGTITITPIDGGEAEVDIDNQMLENDVSKSLGDNQALSQGLLDDLSGANK